VAWSVYVLEAYCVGDIYRNETHFLHIFIPVNNLCRIIQQKSMTDCQGQSLKTPTKAHVSVCV
jgi:hypothetical protein